MLACWGKHTTDRGGLAQNRTWRRFHKYALFFIYPSPSTAVLVVCDKNRAIPTIDPGEYTITTSMYPITWFRSGMCRTRTATSRSSLLRCWTTWSPVEATRLVGSHKLSPAARTSPTSGWVTAGPSPPVRAIEFVGLQSTLGWQTFFIFDFFFNWTSAAVMISCVKAVVVWNELYF